MSDAAITVPVLCRFWAEDHVWNGVAEDLAVAAFGDAFEIAVSHLREAIESHLEALLEAGELSNAVAQLEERAREYGFLTLHELTSASPLLKMLITVKRGAIVTVT